MGDRPDQRPLPNWARACGDPLPGGNLRQTPADFQVTEIAGFEFSGDGEHDFLWVEKCGSNTFWVANRLAEFAGVRMADVGIAGMKDRHAITRQWFSVHRKRGAIADWDRFSIPGAQILEQARHNKKLRRGSHAGNRFEIVLRNIKELGNDITNRLETIRHAGVPNYFGEQRFGKDGQNLQQARLAFTGRRLRRQSRSLALSAARSYLFNRVLQARVVDGSWDSLRVGDCASLQGSNSVFRVAEVDDELLARCRDMDIHPSGPLWGSGDPMTSGQVAAMELSIVMQDEDLASGLERTTKLGRRALRVTVAQFDWDVDKDSLRLCFELPGGSYATAVLREIAAYVDCGAGRAASAN